MALRVEHDPEADAAYVYLDTARRHKTRRIDRRRIVDLAADGSIIGVEFLSVSQGVDIGGLPQNEAIASALAERGIALVQPIR